MLSRVADAIHWMARYMERAENVARAVDVELQLMLDPPEGMTPQWEPLVAASGGEELFKERYGEANSENVIRFLTFDPAYPSSIVSCLRQARENARSIRDRITSEMWEQLNKFHLMLQSSDAPRRASESPYDFFTEVRMAAHLFQGVTDATMMRGEEWRFLTLGAMLERADQTTRILDVKYFMLLPHPSDVGTVVDDVLWGTLLRSVSGYESFRRRHGRIQPLAVVDFLLLDRDFPRALLYCLTRAEESLLALSGTPMGAYRNPAEQRLCRLRAELAYQSVEEVMALGLHEYLDSLQSRLLGVGDAVFASFFAPVPIESAYIEQ